MQFKLVPPVPDSLDDLDVARRAVPLVPASEDDCTERLLRRLDLPSRDVARTWLTFLRALGLAAETDRGFRRTEVEPTPDRLRRRLLDRVFLARPVRDAVAAADAPMAAAAAFDAVRDRVPPWERHKNPRTWESVWRDRVADLLGWLALVDVVDRREAGYVADEAGG